MQEYLDGSKRDQNQETNEMENAEFDSHFQPCWLSRSQSNFHLLYKMIRNPHFFDYASHLYYE
ncbi:hypothetical protein ACSBR1_005964 [Camellia fascicularis]